MYRVDDPLFVNPSGFADFVYDTKYAWSTFDITSA